MKAIEELSNPASCFNKADAHEPVFVLLARDPMAPATIRLWAKMSTGTQPDEKIEDALAQADSMDKWREENVKPQARTRKPRKPAVVAAPPSDGAAGSGGTL